MPDNRSSRLLQLQQGLLELGLEHDEGLAESLLVYLDLLQRWNKAYNLTAVREPAQMITRHLLDSLSVVPYIPPESNNLVDVGSGAGLPGVPLALFFPDKEFHLLDSNGKKTRFLFQVKTELGLANMSVHRVRAENWTPPREFDVVLSRAFASLPEMVTTTRHLCDEHGSFLAMKGVLPETEIAELEQHIEIKAIHRLQVPGLDEQRHLVELRPALAA